MKFNFHNNYYVIGAAGKTPYDCLMIPGAETENGNCVHSKAVANGVSYCVEVWFFSKNDHFYYKE